MNTQTQTIAFEGMPHSGKTSTLNYIRSLKRQEIYFLDELYFTKGQLDTLTDKRGTILESKWFIDQEIKRKVNIAQAITEGFKTILIDRTYLCTLAYCYARSKINNNPQEFQDLVAYLDQNRDALPKYDKVIVFENRVEKSLGRRKDQNEPDSGYWNDKDFMKYFQEFYDQQIDKYLTSKIIRINTTDMSLSDIYIQADKIINKS